MNEATQLQLIEEVINDLDRLVDEKQYELAQLTDERRGLLLARTRLTSALLTVAGTSQAPLLVGTPRRTDPPTEWKVWSSQRPDLMTSSGDVIEVKNARADGPSGNFTEDVKVVLQEAPYPLSASDVMTILNTRGHELTDTRPVRGALAYLKRIGVATFPETGQWMWIDSDTYRNYMSERQQQPDVFSSTEAPSADAEEASGMENTNQESEQQSPVAAG